MTQQDSNYIFLNKCRSVALIPSNADKFLDRAVSRKKCYNPGAPNFLTYYGNISGTNHLFYSTVTSQIFNAMSLW